MSVQATSLPSQVDASPHPRARIDRFVRTTSPQILRLALQPDAARLLEDLAPLGAARPGRAWRRITPPLRKCRILLQLDCADLLRLEYCRETVDAFLREGSDEGFVGTHLPHIAAEAQLTERATSNGVGQEIAEVVRLATVVAALSAMSLGVGIIPEGLTAVDEDVAVFTRPRKKSRGPATASPVPNLVSAYLRAKEKETA